MLMLLAVVGLFVGACSGGDAGVEAGGQPVVEPEGGDPKVEPGAALGGEVAGDCGSHDENGRCIDDPEQETKRCLDGTARRDTEPCDDLNCGPYADCVIVDPQPEKTCSVEECDATKTKRDPEAVAFGEQVRPFCDAAENRTDKFRDDTIPAVREGLVQVPGIVDDFIADTAGLDAPPVVRAVWDTYRTDLTAATEVLVDAALAVLDTFDDDDNVDEALLALGMDEDSTAALEAFEANEDNFEESFGFRCFG